MGGKILTEQFYTNRNCIAKEEEKRIDEAATKIILKDIRNIYYDFNNYNTPHRFMNGVEEDVPDTLKILLQGLIKTHKKNQNDEKWDKRVNTIAHCIISSVRPRSFVSHILLGLACQIYKKYGGTDLIESFSYVGLTATYKETQRFEECLMNDLPEYILDGSFVQFSFDNTDHNTRTLNGTNTVHIMSGIMNVTPLKKVLSKKECIERSKKKLTEESVNEFGFMTLQKFNRG